MLDAYLSVRPGDRLRAGVPGRQAPDRRATSTFSLLPTYIGDIPYPRRHTRGLSSAAQRAHPSVHTLVALVLVPILLRTTNGGYQTACGSVDPYQPRGLTRSTPASPLGICSRRLSRLPGPTTPRRLGCLTQYSRGGIIHGNMGLMAPQVVSRVAASASSLFIYCHCSRVQSFSVLSTCDHDTVGPRPRGSRLPDHPPYPSPEGLRCRPIKLEGPIPCQQAALCTYRGGTKLK